MFGTETLVDDSFSIDNESNTNSGRCFSPPSDNILRIAVGNGVVNHDLFLGKFFLVILGFFQTNLNDFCRVEFWEFCFHFLIVLWDYHLRLSVVSLGNVMRLNMERKRERTRIP